jgi:hypothetical protein|uniref:CHCH domain-containing protein n=1 Tax=Picea sitchensis TaxID=3332 RepID=B8LNI0_PICSI|nr:unknown [Picea sitchensis]
MSGFPSSSSSSTTQQQEAEPVCGDEALKLLNCVASTPYQEEKCVALLSALRTCIIQKKVGKFSLAKQEDHQSRAPASKK